MLGIHTDDFIILIHAAADDIIIRFYYNGRQSCHRYIVAHNWRSKIDLLLKNHWSWPRYGGGLSLEVIYTENAFGTPNGDR